ncbi:LysR family transcriptional regulator [Chitinibacter sp. ZOR0017]|uniref:LysR family transcriptional regulator n=1 Tax=Chitinibacter sp. ZOR0017 TaxID=1339254 RepID=UPI000646823C|nr:LysR family transcriptional regulator [Chitinibacter sp. ZOR0017]
MDLSALQIFVKVVQTGSFTAAAKALGSQKAHLSRVLSQLEQELGVRLLARTTRSLSLTEVGRELFERAVGILAALEDARRVVQNAQGEPRGTLRLSCGVEFGMIAVSGWIQQYLQRYPHVSVDADYTSRVVDLVHEGFDLAIRIGSLPDSNLAARKLGELRYGLYAHPSYLARMGQPLHPADLGAHQLLAFAGGSHRPLWRLSRAADSQPVEFTPRLKANNIFTVRDAALAGLGIAALPTLVAQPEVERGTLNLLLADWSLPAIPVHAVFASARYLTPKVRSFIDLALEAMPAG